jgi:hypothetical protein
MPEQVVNGADIVVSAIAGAGIVVSGALYALFFALDRMRQASWLRAAAWISYLALVVCTVLLAQALSLDGIWLVVIAVMLIGYLLAPRAIWRLSTATHTHDDQAPNAASRS